MHIYLVPHLMPRKCRYCTISLTTFLSKSIHTKLIRTQLFTNMPRDQEYRTFQETSLHHSNFCLHHRLGRQASICFSVFALHNNNMKNPCRPIFITPIHFPCPFIIRFRHPLSIYHELSHPPSIPCSKSTHTEIPVLAQDLWLH